MKGRLIEQMPVLDRLFAAVALAPPGQKLSIPRLRDALVDQGDVLNGLQKLVDLGMLDRQTLRPVVREPKHRAKPERRISGEGLARLIEAYAAKHGLAMIRVSQHLFGHKQAFSRLRRPGLAPRQSTIDKVQAFLDGDPPAELKAQRAGGPRKADNGGVTGAELAERFDALIAEHGLSKTRVGKAINGQRSGLEELRRRTPRRATVEKCLALLDEPDLIEMRPRDRWAARRAKAASRAAETPAAGPSRTAGERERAPTMPRAPAPAPGSFEEQLARVARGEVGIAPNFKISKADPNQTLGGVTGAINI